MSDHDTLPPEVDDEIRARLQAFAREVAEHADTETALGRMPRRSRPPTFRVVAIAACLLAVVALAAVILDRLAVETTGPSDSPTQTTDCLTTTRPRAITPGEPMKTRFTATVASAATAIMLLGACSDNGPTTLAEGDDVELVGDDGLGARTLNISAEEEDGKVTGEFRNNDVVVKVECANTDTDGVVILSGEVTADPKAEVGVGERLALIIREGDPDSVALVPPNHGPRSCTEFLESIPERYLTDDSNFVDVEPGEDITTG
jgi:hypothetical protein